MLYYLWNYGTITLPVGTEFGDSNGDLLLNYSVVLGFAGVGSFDGLYDLVISLALKLGYKYAINY